MIDIGGEGVHKEIFGGCGVLIWGGYLGERGNIEKKKVATGTCMYMHVCMW